MNPFRSIPALSAAALATVLCAPLGAEEKVSFSDDVRPVLERSCLTCHGEAQRLSGLDLRTRAAMLKGGKRGPAITPGDASKSSLIAHVSGAAEPKMPMGGSLGEAEIAMLSDWINQGAETGADAESEQGWWAFRPPVDHPAPQVGDAAWQQNPIDAFVKQRLDEAGVEPAPEADRRTLIRRAYLDLVGLLPPPEEVEAFVADRSPDAWEKLIDRLLASPHYGERWGRHWLDVVRYADSGGYEHDFDYPNAWRFRDYVIRSFNDDKPYDRFVVEQLAGDELPGSDFDNLIATGFYRIGARILYREKDNPDYRYNYLDDMIATTARGFLAMSVDCARCHDHKFDPIKQLDYYRMMAVFYPHIRYDYPLAAPKVVAEHERRTAEVESQIKPLRERVAEIQAPYKKRKFREKLATFPAEIQEAVNTPEEQRSEGQKLLAAQVSNIGGGSVEDILSDQDRRLVASLDEQIEALEKELPEALPTAMGIRDGDFRSAPDGSGDQVQPGKGNRIDYQNVGPWIPTSRQAYEPPPAHLLPTADYRTLGPVVTPGLLSALAGEDEFRATPPANERVSTGRRMALAQWIASPDNPLTARVAVNRIWQHHFGSGLVYTASNFGTTGTKPTHPELLDRLTLDFIKDGWSFKAMHRRIMTSRVYRAAASYGSRPTPDGDPENHLLGRYPQRRLEAEIMRDALLTASGKINLQQGGKPFFPPIPQSVRDSFLKGRWDMTDEEGPAVWRRSVYAYQKRGLRYPMFEVFDQPNMNIGCERRTTTTVPTQALTLLNNEFVLGQAAYFAERVAHEAGDDPAAQMERAYAIALGRPPSATERTTNLEFLRKQRVFHDKRGAPAEQSALVDLCDVILNLNEFVYIN